MVAVFCCKNFELFESVTWLSSTLEPSSWRFSRSSASRSYDHHVINAKSWQFLQQKAATNATFRIWFYETNISVDFWHFKNSHLLFSKTIKGFVFRSSNNSNEWYRTCAQGCFQTRIPRTNWTTDKGRVSNFVTVDSDWPDIRNQWKRKKVPQDTKKIRKVFHGFVYATMEIDSPIQGKFTKTVCY